MQDKDEKKFLTQEMMGELIKRKRLEMGYLQEELGIRVGYAPSSAKQAISQIERGAVPVPARRLQNFVEELLLDEQLFRQLAFYLDINDYNEATRRLDRYIKQQFGYSILEKKAVEVAPPPATPAQQPAPSKAEQEMSELELKLQKLAALANQGLITGEEYEQNKQRLLDKYL